MSFFHLKSGTLTTFYYGGETEASELDGIFPCVKRRYDGEDYSDSDGMLYVFGNDISDRFALDGDTLGGRTVRKQEISVDGYSYVVGKLRPIFSGGRLHHMEIGVI
ncbi:MAG: hypothetical protein MR038_03800 [Oscillospiraceae bacterium]|nr:hypothetical protein [Oscillospiraceae bacterium]